MLLAVGWVFVVVARGFRGWSMGATIVTVLGIGLGVCLLVYLVMLVLRRGALRARAFLPPGGRTAAVLTAEGDLAAFDGRFVAVGPDSEGLRLDTGAGLTALLPWSEVAIEVAASPRGGPLQLTTTTGRVSLLPDGAAALRAHWIDICAIADSWSERKLREAPPPWLTRTDGP